MSSPAASLNRTQYTLHIVMNGARSGDIVLQLVVYNVLSPPNTSARLLVAVLGTLGISGLTTF